MNIKRIYWFVLAVFLLSIQNGYAEQYRNEFVEISSPKKGIVYNSPTINITGRVSDTIERITINDKKVAILRQGQFFSKHILQEPGEYEFIVKLYEATFFSDKLISKLPNQVTYLKEDDVSLWRLDFRFIYATS